jgi:hypothetical protein
MWQRNGIDDNREDWCVEIGQRRRKGIKERQGQRLVPYVGGLRKLTGEGHQKSQQWGIER